MRLHLCRSAGGITQTPRQFFFDGKNFGTTCFYILVSIEDDKVDAPKVCVLAHGTYGIFRLQFLIATCVAIFAWMNDATFGGFLAE